MERRELEILSLNIAMADHDEESLTRRRLAQQQASQEIAGAFRGDLPEDAQMPDDFEEAVDYATDIVYRSSFTLFSPGDIRRIIEHREDFRKRGDISWAPIDSTAMDLVIELATIGAKLSSVDRTPAFGPHVKAIIRPWEIVEDPRTQFNKFGQIIFLD